MSVFFAKQGLPERRAIDLSAWIRGEYASGRTGAGVVVNTDSAMGVGAYWSSVHLLASIVSNLPVDVFRGSGADRREVTPTPALVARPSLVVTAREWRYQAMVSMLSRGNAVGVALERGPAQSLRTVEWLDPDAVTIDQASPFVKPTYSVSGQQINPLDVVHLRAFVRPGSAVGLSVVAKHAETLGINLAAESYGAEWFGGGGHPTAILKNTEQTVEDKDARKVKARWLASTRGKREPMVTGKDWSYIPIQSSAAESQFLEAMGYSDAKIARLFGPGVAEVLGYAAPGGNGSLTYTNRVDRSLDLLTYTVMQWVTKFEDFWVDALPQPQTARMNVNALLRADNKTRREIYRIDREIGLHNIDELRAFEDELPLPDGQGQDYTPLGASNGGQTDADA